MATVRSNMDIGKIWTVVKPSEAMWTAFDHQEKHVKPPGAIWTALIPS